jgi:hypothetical protein
MQTGSSGTLLSLYGTEYKGNAGERGYGLWEVKTGFCQIDQCKPVLPRLSLAENLGKPLMSLYMGPNGGSAAIDSDVGDCCELYSTSNR